MSGTDSEKGFIGKAGDIGAKTLISLLPGGGVITGLYELAQLSAEQLANAIERRSIERLQEFHLQLLDGPAIDPIVAEGLDADNYHALLTACVSDLENGKSIFYGTMAKSLGHNLIPQKYKRYAILALRELSVDQLTILKNAFIAQKYELRAKQGAGRIDPAEFLKASSSDELDELNYEALVRHKMIKDNKLTSLGSILIGACYSETELTPNAIKQSIWRNVFMDIISYDLDTSGGMAFPMALQSYAHQDGFHTGVRAILRDDFALGRPRLYILVVNENPSRIIDRIELIKKTIRNNVLCIVYLKKPDIEITCAFPKAIVIHGEGLGDDKVIESIFEELNKERE